MSRAETRTIRVDALARVEGEGALSVRIRNGVVTDLNFRIYEPPRFFEALLRGQDVSRGAGHHRADLRHLSHRLHAEQLPGDGGALGVRVERPVARPAPADLLRRMDREPRAARGHAPCAGLSRPARRHRDRPPGAGPGRQGAELKKLGNTIIEVIGGRAVHPVNLRVGGFYKAPAKAAIRGLIEPLRRGLDDAVELAGAFAAFDYPDYAGGLHLRLPAPRRRVRHP